MRTDRLSADPLRAAVDVVKGTGGEPFEALPRSGFMTGGKQVLLVEDDKQSMRILERWLADEGYDVVSCARFETARSYLATHTPDVLVTDVRLGAFNGLQLVVMAKDAHPRTVAIVISGFDDPVIKQEAERAGARYLTKPLSREEIIESTHA